MRHKDCYPEVGKKLNKPAIITLNGIKPRAGQSGVEKERKLQEKINQEGGEHISYDKETFVWTFKVNHFTRYGGGDDDDEPSQDSSSNINGKRSEVDLKSFGDVKDIDNEMENMEMDNVSEISN